MVVTRRVLIVAERVEEQLEAPAVLFAKEAYLAVGRDRRAGLLYATGATILREQC